MPAINITVVPFSTTVQYEEIHGSRRESWREDGITCQRGLKCAWDDRHQLALDLRGYLRNDGAGVTFQNPQTFPGLGNCFVSSIEIQPFNPGPQASVIDQTILEYEFVELTVTYANIGNISTEDPVHDDEAEASTEVLITESLEPTVEFLTLPNRKLFWDTGAEQSDQLQVDESPGFQIRMMEWIYTIHFMPFIPADAMDLQGFVNDATLTSPSLGKSWAAETLLYFGASPSRQITSQGIQAWEITYRFGIREQGWNNYPKAGVDGFTFQPIYKDGGDRLINYPLADLSSLLLG